MLGVPGVSGRRCHTIWKDIAIWPIRGCHECMRVCLGTSADSPNYPAELCKFSIASFPQYMTHKDAFLPYLYMESVDKPVSQCFS